MKRSSVNLPFIDQQKRTVSFRKMSFVIEAKHPEDQIICANLKSSLEKATKKILELAKRKGYRFAYS